MEELVELFAAEPSDWLVPFLRIAAKAGETEASRAAVGSPSGPRKEVRVDLIGTPPSDEVTPDEAAFPIRWRTSGYVGVFPDFEGRITVRRVSPEVSEVDIRGEYELPGALRRRAGPSPSAERAAGALLGSLLRNLRDAVEEQARTEAHLS